MFNADFYPTPKHVIELMLQDENLQDKIVLEPSAGKGDIVDYVQDRGAEAIACENNPDLLKILATKCKVVAEDFLSVESHQISHVDYIVMNPPFSADEKHINHAWNIAPDGCKIIALCNANTIENDYSRSRKELNTIIENYGSFQNLGNCFSDAERSTNVEIGLITLIKPGNSNSEFDGFFMGEESEEAQYSGLMPYNFVRDVVNRYVEAVKIYDEQLNTAVKMNALIEGFYKSKLAFTCIEENKPKNRNYFKKDLQKSAWSFILGKMKMEKYTTKGLKDDLNKFVEQQQQVPFTMRNIYKMLDLIIGTQEQRMDKALLEVFDRLTQHYHENRYNVEGWKTNSHFLINEKFIIPYMVDTYKWSWNEHHIHLTYSANTELIEDMVKAICYIIGFNYDNTTSLYSFLHNNKCEYGKWYSWGFFEIRGYKKGTMHFKFNSQDLWGQFNQRIAKIKGYPLYESKRKAA